MLVFSVGERVVGLEPGLHLDGISADLTLDWGWGGCSKYSSLQLASDNDF